jgi:hypothetical protein
MPLALADVRASVHRNGAECVVLGAVFRFFASWHWLWMVVDDEFFESRIHSVKNRVARILPCRNLRSGRSPTLQKKRNSLKHKAG